MQLHLLRERNNKIGSLVPNAQLRFLVIRVWHLRVSQMRRQKTIRAPLITLLERYKQKLSQRCCLKKHEKKKVLIDTVIILITIILLKMIKD